MGIFQRIDIKNFTPDTFGLKNKWMLITTAKPDGTVNTMTASWGGFGVMWNKEVVFVVIRPQRYTKEFVDNAESFSLTFFDNSHKKALSHLGAVSGRDEDKIAKTGLTVAFDQEIPYFEEAKDVVFAKKLFIQPLEESSFLDRSLIDKWYPEKDFHYLYIAEITNILSKNAK